eukprot:4383065-Pyramimonas_sp.AAC.1
MSRASVFTCRGLPCRQKNQRASGGHAACVGGRGNGRDLARSASESHKHFAITFINTHTSHLTPSTLSTNAVPSRRGCTVSRQYAAQLLLRSTGVRGVRLDMWRC